MNENAGKLTITVNLDVQAPSGTSVDVILGTAQSPPATENVDFSLPIQTAFFTQGTTSKTFDIYLTDDELSESNEKFQLVLSNPQGTYQGDPIGIGNPSATVVTITNTTPNSWLLTASDQRGNDPQQRDLERLGHFTLSLHNSNLSVQHAFGYGYGNLGSVDAWISSMGQPALVYNSDYADIRPVFETTVSSMSGDTISSITRTLTINGQQQTPIVNNNPGTLPNNAILAQQFPTQGTQTGVISWTLDVTVALSGRGPVLRTITGTVFLKGQSGAIAPGWGIAGFDRIVPLTGGRLWVYGSGGTRFFTGSGPTFTSPANDFGTLVQNPGGDYTYTALDQVVWNFDSGGKLTSIVDPHNLARTFSYSSGNLQAVIEPDGARTTFTYSSGYLATIVQPGNRTITITRDSQSGDLIGIHDPGGLRTFTYDANHHLTNDRWGDINTTFTYSGSTYLLTDVDRGLGNTATVDSAVGRLLSASPTITESSVKGVLTDAYNVKTTFSYDRQGRLLAIEGYGSSNNESWQRNSAGQVTQYQDPLNNLTTYVYNATTHDLTKMIRPDGSVFTFQYDSTYHRLTMAQDSMSRITTFTYNSVGDLVKIQDPLNRVTTLTWSSDGVLSSMIDPLNRTTSLSRISGQRKIGTIVDALGNRTTFTYDGSGFLSTVKDALSRVTTYSYDGLGRVTNIVDPLSQSTTYAYNQQGQLTSVNEQGLRSLAQSYNALGLMSGRLVYDIVNEEEMQWYSYGYDYAGRQTTQVDEIFDRTTTYAYNSAGWLTSATDPAGNITTYTYLQDGKLSTVKDALSRVTTYVYDARGRIHRVDDPLLGVTYYEYDSENNLTKVTDPLSRVTSFGGGGGGSGAGLNWGWGQVWSGGMWGGTNGGGGYRGRSSPGGGNLVPLPSPIMPPPSNEPPGYEPHDGGAGGGSGGSGGGWGGGLVPLPSPPMPPPHDPPRPEPMDGGGGDPNNPHGGGSVPPWMPSPPMPEPPGDLPPWLRPQPMDGGGGDPNNPHGGGSVPPWMPSPPMPGPPGDLPPWLRPQPMDGGGGDPGNPHGGGSVPPWMPSPPVPGPRDDGDLPPWLRPQPMDGGGGSGGGGGWFTNWGPGSYPGDRNWNWDWPGSGNFPIEPDDGNGGGGQGGRGRPGNNWNTDPALDDGFGGGGRGDRGAGGNWNTDPALFDGGGGGGGRGRPGNNWGTDPTLWGQGQVASGGGTWQTLGISFEDWIRERQVQALGTAPLNDDGRSREHVQYAAIGSQGPGGYQPPASDRPGSKNPVMVAPPINGRIASKDEVKKIGEPANDAFQKRRRELMDSDEAQEAMNNAFLKELFGLKDDELRDFKEKAGKAINRVTGAMQAAMGAAEAIASAPLWLVCPPLAAAIGLHALDNFYNGANSVIDGENHQTQTAAAVRSVLERLGLPPELANIGGELANGGIGAGAIKGSAKIKDMVRSGELPGSTGPLNRPLNSVPKSLAKEEGGAAPLNGNARDQAVTPKPKQPAAGVEEPKPTQPTPPRAGGYQPPPKEITGIEGLERAKPKTPVQGGGGLRKRWKDKQGNIYEWDSQHGTLEKYNKKGKHQGEFDPKTGQQIKPADSTRSVEP